MTPARASHLRTQRMQGAKTNRETREAVKAGEEVAKGKWTINRLWLAYKENKPNLKGIITDENRFENYIKPHFGSKEPKDIIPLDVDRLRLKLLKSKAAGTVRNVLELLRRIVNFGTKKNLCQGLGFTIEMPRVDNIRTEDLTPEQLTSLLEAIKQDDNIQVANLMKMALFTGMRRGELFKLKWADIDFEKGFIHIRSPKSGISQKIPLNNGARAILEGHVKTGSGYVFPGRGGRQRTDIKHQANRIKEKA